MITFDTKAERNYCLSAAWLVIIIYGHIAWPPLLWLALAPIFGMSHYGGQIYRENVKYYGR